MASSDVPEWRIDRAEVLVDRFKLVGQGGFGSLFLATWLNSTAIVKQPSQGEAAESLFSAFRSTRQRSRSTMEKEDPETILRSFVKEADIWYRLNHPHVVQLFGACDLQWPPMFVCEYATLGSLEKYLQRYKNELWSKLYETALGIQYLHQRGITHGDLKCNNIVVGSDVKAKVTDFGLSSGLRNADQKVSVALTGAFRWLAPECLGDKAERQPSTIQSDIYSFGMCIIEALMIVEDIHEPSVPWWNIDDSAVVAYEVKKCRKLPDRPGNCTDNQWNLVKRMCVYEPARRITIGTVVFELEQLAAEEANSEKYHKVQDEVTNLQDFEGGFLERKWRSLQRELSKIDASNDLYDRVVDILQFIFERLSAGNYSVSLMKYVYNMFEELEGINSNDFQRYRVTDLKTSYTDIAAFIQRMDALCEIMGIDNPVLLGDETSWTPICLFVANDPDIWLVSKELKSKRERSRFVEFLMSEVSEKTSTYSSEHIAVIKTAIMSLKYQKASISTTPRWFIPRHELIVDYALRVGRGGFGQVYPGKWLGSVVIVKEVTFSLLQPPSESSLEFSSDDSFEESEAQPQTVEVAGALAMFTNEVEIWFGLSHPHVVRLYGACNVGSLFFVCEYATKGSLDKYLRKHPDQIWTKLKEAALGVKYLHERGIIHGDLKCNNIVVAADGSAKVTDFGLSGSKEGFDPNGQFSAAWRWMAPECLQLIERTSASDIFSLGMCIVEALRVVHATSEGLDDKTYSRLPWGRMDDSAVKYHVTRHKLPPQPETCTDAQWGIVEQMCRPNPADRLSIEQVVEELEAFETKGTGSSSIARAF